MEDGKKGTRFAEEQMLSVLQEHEAGAKVADVCRRHGISERTLYRRRQKYGGLEVSELRWHQGLVEENARLQRLAAGKALDNQMLKELLR